MVDLHQNLPKGFGAHPFVKGMEFINTFSKFRRFNAFPEMKTAISFFEILLWQRDYSRA